MNYQDSDDWIHVDDYWKEIKRLEDKIEDLKIYVLDQEDEIKRLKGFSYTTEQILDIADNYLGYSDTGNFYGETDDLLNFVHTILSKEPVT
jgi:hypothetical protein